LGDSNGGPFHLENCGGYFGVGRGLPQLSGVKTGALFFYIWGGLLLEFLKGPYGENLFLGKNFGCR